MFNADKWVDQEIAKHTTPESRAERLASEIWFRDALIASPLKRPSNVTVRDWAESQRSHDLLIARLQS